MGHRKSILAVSTALVSGLLAFSLWAANVTLEEIPVKAREALLRLAGDSKITEVEVEKERGIVVYEAEWIADGVEVEAEVTADGVLLEIEEGVRPENVPEAVRATAANALAGAPQIHYEKHTIVFYEAEGKMNGKNVEISISPMGRLTGQDDDDDGDDKDDNDDDEK